MVAAGEKAFGPVSVVISNAGVPWPFGPLWVNDPEKWWQTQEIHLKGPMLLAHRVLPGMLERRKGHIIFVSSNGSHLIVSGASAYCVGKLAVRRFAELLAFETREAGVAVFAIDPGFAFTQLAVDTINSPDAQRWMPQMVEQLKHMDKSNVGDLERCAQRCVDLACGRYDALSGSYSELKDDLEQLLRDRTPS